MTDAQTALLRLGDTVQRQRAEGCDEYAVIARSEGHVVVRCEATGHHLRLPIEKPRVEVHLPEHCPQPGTQTP